MRLLKSYSMMTVLFTAMLMSACNTDENPCPGVSLDVEIDSANLTAQVIASGLNDLDFDLYINDHLYKSFTAGELDSVDLSYQFEPGEYKICVIAEIESCDQRIEGCIEFEIENPNREECLGLAFRTDAYNDHYYKFFADFDAIETLEYAWVVNGDVVKEEPLSDNRTNYLEWEFGSGTHSVCIKAESEECGEVMYCEEIIVEQGCVEEVSFTTQKENNYTYYFYADFEGKYHTKYKWYVNDDFVDIEIPGAEETNHKLYWQFGPGTHNVCLVTDQDGCEAVELCETIVVEEVPCVDLSYSAELTVTDTTDFYTFTADFEDRDDVTYIWKVFINDDFQGQEIRYAGSEDDHTFIWHFEPGVAYEICLKQDDCNDTQICEVYLVE